MATNIDGYIYMIHLREFINANQPVYKIGKTKQLDSRKRIQSYPKSSCLIIQIGCSNTDKKETNIRQESI